MRRLLLAGLLLLVACELPQNDAPPTPAEADAEGRTARIVELLEELEEVATDHDGTRYSGSPGYDASVDWVAGKMEAAGYEVTRYTADLPIVHPRPGSRVDTASLHLKDGRDLRTMLYSPAGRVEGGIVPLDFLIDIEGRRGPGCTPFFEPPFPPGSVVLVRPGPCFRRDQVVNLADAGAAAVLFSYPEFHTGGVLRPTLLSPEGIDIPVLAVSDEAGEDLASGEHGDAVRVVARTRIDTQPVESVIAESPVGSEGEVVMLGAHLDSVVDGPGINDNGSGVAALIALAEDIDPSADDARVRFAFWGAEELGLLGSTAYVQSLTAEELDAIAAYVNVDMIGSVNYARWIYDDEGSPLGSERIARVFEDYFDELDLTSRRFSTQGASDHGPFLRAGVPIGGVYSGSDETKTRYEERLFGGEARAPMDPCYHRACDDLDNINRAALTELAGAVAHVLESLTN